MHQTMIKVPRKTTMTLFPLLALFLIIFVANSAIAKDDQIIFKAVSAVRGDPSRVYLEAFKDALELYTADKVHVDIYDAGTFGSQQDTARGVRKGVPDFALPATNNLSTLSPSFGGVLSLPYLISSEEQMIALRKAPIWDKLKNKLEEEAGLKVLGQSLVGFRWIINSKKPVQSAEDMKGLKIRVPPVPQYIAAFKSWGVPPTPIPWNETSGALQQGVIDGLDNPAGVLLAFKFYEQAKYITKLNYALLTASMIMGKKNFDSQPPDIQKAILRAAEDAQLWQYRTYQFRQNSTIEALKSHGVQFSEIKDEAKFQTQAQSTWPELSKRSGGEEWVQEIQSAIEQIK